tara:strand:- start:1 stop:447 length:447 start_codon:yes stop_codon:yes gene_type:complete
MKTHNCARLGEGLPGKLSIKIVWIHQGLFMTDGIDAAQREQHAKHIAMNGADISGPIERHRAGKNGFVIDDFGEHLVLKNNEAITVVADGKERVLAAWDVFRQSLNGLDPEQAKRIDEAAVLFASRCSHIGGEVSRDIDKANLAWKRR